jgi:hypothetical protein
VEQLIACWSYGRETTEEEAVAQWRRLTDRSGRPYRSPSPCMSAVEGTLWPQRCPLQRPLRVGPLLSPPRSSVSLFITLNTVLWVHE